MDYVVDEEQFRLETLSSHTQYLDQLHLESEKMIETMQIEKVKPSNGVKMKETSMKRSYTHYSDQDKVRFFKLLFGGSAFHINLKRSMAWSKKGSPAAVTVPKTRATTTTILGAISAEGLIKCNLRPPQPPSSKKRKRGDGIGYVRQRNGYRTLY